MLSVNLIPVEIIHLADEKAIPSSKIKNDPEIANVT
jgi:hypothetical protein